jgi:hypothetical protein
MSAEISRRRAIASAVKRPCLNAFRLPSVRPVRPGRASGTYRLPSLVTGTASLSAFALRNVSPGACPSAGLILPFGPYPPLHAANNGLPAIVDVDVFDGGFLLPLTAMPVECFEQGSVRA